MPNPRFRIRTLMIAVATVALMLGVVLWVQRENERQALAKRQALLEAIGRLNFYEGIDFTTLLGREPSGGDQPPDIPPDPPVAPDLPPHEDTPCPSPG